MSYKIVGDSCTDPTPEMLTDPHFSFVPLTLHVGGATVIDDETFDQAAYLKAVREAPDCPTTACPSPELYKNSYGEADWTFVVTLSSHLSGSYNSAVVAKNIYEEEHGTGKKIYVVDSESACCGQTQIALKLRELCEAGLSFDEVVSRINAYRDSLKTYFVLETLDHLRKNGRLTGIKAILATALNIKPVMSATKGVIIQLGQDRGMKRALQKMVKMALDGRNDTENRRLMITHVNALARAQAVRDLILSQKKFLECIIVDARGVATNYAADGGIVVTF